MNDKADNLIPVAEPLEPGFGTVLAEAPRANTTGALPLSRDVIDVYQSYLQTMWNQIALSLGPTVTACVLRSIILQGDRPKGSLGRYLDITEQGISLRRLEGKLGHAGSAALMNELVTFFPQLCNALDSLAFHILAALPEDDSGGDTEPVGER